MRSFFNFRLRDLTELADLFLSDPARALLTLLSIIGLMLIFYGVVHFLEKNN